MSKRLALVLVLVLASSSLIAVGSVSGVSEPTEFTVQLVAHSYDIPTTYSIDSYTGKNITHLGYHVENKSIEVTIKNRPFTRFTTGDGNTINLYYNVRAKGYFEENWTELFSDSGEYPSLGSYPEQDYESQYTVLTIPAAYPSNAKVDFQVKALVGYFTKVYLGNTPVYGNVFTGASSGWSDTQTLTIGESQTLTPSPTIPESTVLVATASVVAVVVISAGLLVYFKKRKHEAGKHE